MRFRHLLYQRTKTAESEALFIFPGDQRRAQLRGGSAAGDYDGMGRVSAGGWGRRARLERWVMVPGREDRVMEWRGDGAMDRWSDGVMGGRGAVDKDSARAVPTRSLRRWEEGRKGVEVEEE